MIYQLPKLLKPYLLLSIGDGLVAQIPSLLLSIATAIIVTRVSSAQNMSEHITKQVNLSAGMAANLACYTCSRFGSRNA